MNKNNYIEFDKELDVRDAIRFAEDHFRDFLHARENPHKVKYTTAANWLGIESPSLVDYRVIGGHTRGRILKKAVKDGDRYNVIGYDAEERPLFITHVNEFGRRETKFFFDLQGYRWAMELHESDNPFYNGKHRYGDVYKFRYDELGRIVYFATINPGHSSRTEKYEYMDDASIICHMYYYIPGRSGSDKSIPSGFKGSPMDEYRYEISAELDIKEFFRKGNDYSFIREIRKSKTTGVPKPAAGSYEKFETWLNGVLTDKEIPTGGGILFLLFGPNEDGIGVSLEVCKTFDPDNDDWACDPYFSSPMHMIGTTGLCEHEQALKSVASMIRKYKRSGEQRLVLKKYSGIGAGFSDGDIIIP